MVARAPADWWCRVRVVRRAGAALYPLIGRDFFPAVDAGQFRLHVSRPPGTRIEETEKIFGRVAERSAQTFRRRKIDTVLDNIGIPIQRRQPVA